LAIIAVATSDDTKIDVHFGQATSFQIYDVALDGSYKHLEHRKISPAASGSGESTHAAATIEQLPDVDVVLVNRIGTGPSRALEGRGTRAFALSGSVDVA
jgi:nitrogen fixation protein NifB